MVLQYYRRARVYISISPISSVRCQCSRAQQFGMSKVEFQQVGDRGNDERSLLVNMSDVEMLTS